MWGGGLLKTDVFAFRKLTFRWLQSWQVSCWRRTVRDMELGKIVNVVWKRLSLWKMYFCVVTFALWCRSAS